MPVLWAKTNGLSRNQTLQVEKEEKDIWAKRDESGVGWRFQGVKGGWPAVGRYKPSLHRKHGQMSVLEKGSNSESKSTDMEIPPDSWEMASSPHVSRRMLTCGLEFPGASSWPEECLVDPGQRVCSNGAQSWSTFPRDFKAVVGSVLYLYNQQKESILEKTAKEGSWG